MAMSVDDANDDFPGNSRIILLTSTCKVVKTENTSTSKYCEAEIDICRKTTFSKKSLTGPGFFLCLKYREPAYF